MSQESLRKYQAVWLQVKKNSFCEISAHKAYHRRIIKAVTKEKDMDLGYKLECTEAYPPIEATMRTKITGSVVRFTLHIKPLITLDTI